MSKEKEGKGKEGKKKNREPQTDRKEKPVIITPAQKAAPPRTFSLSKPSLPQIPSGKFRLPRLSLFVFLLLLGAGDIYLKKYLGYEPKTSLTISFILFFIFLVAVRANKIYRSLVIVTLALDVILSQGLLYFLPETELKNIFIAIKVFIWLILAVVLFLLEMIEHLSAGEKPPLYADLILLVIVAALIFLLLPQLTNTYYLQTQTHQEYFETAVETLEKVSGPLAEAKNTLSDQLACIFQIGQGQKQPECLEEKRLARYCQEQTKDELNYQKCLTEQKEKKAQELIPVKGVISQAIEEATELKLEIPPYFPEIVYLQEGKELAVEYPLNLLIKNPRRQAVGIQADCLFQKGKDNVSGTAKIRGEDALTLSKEKDTLRLTCTPDENLEGTYQLIYLVKISNLKTLSFLKRAFLSPQGEEDKESVLPEIMADQFPHLASTLSQAYPELAWINFGFGRTEADPIISPEDLIVFAAAVENSGQGEIIQIRSYQFDLAEQGFTPIGGQADCLQGGEKPFPPKAKTSYLTNCLLELPSELKSFEKKYRPQTFTAELVYDYQLTKETKIEVKVIKT